MFTNRKMTKSINVSRNMDETNCLGIHCFAEVHACTDLMNRAKSFVLKHFQVTYSLSRLRPAFYITFFSVNLQYLYVCCLFISRNNSIQKKASEEEPLPREIPLYSFPVVCVIVWLGGTDALGASLVLINNFLSASLSLSCPRTSSFYVTTFIVLPCKTVRCTIERYNNAPVRYIYQANILRVSK